MAAVDLAEIAQFQQKTSDPRLDRFFMVTISTIVLELSGFYVAALWIGWGALIVLVSQIWFQCLAKIQLQPSTEKIIDHGIGPRTALLSIFSELGRGEKGKSRGCNPYKWALRDSDAV